MCLSFSAFILRKTSVPQKGSFQLWFQDVTTDGLDQVQILATKSTRIIWKTEHHLDRRDSEISENMTLKIKTTAWKHIFIYFKFHTLTLGKGEWDLEKEQFACGILL